MPVRDYCRKAWPADSRRAAVANTELFDGHIGVLSEVSGDLDEYPKTTGLPDYRSNCGCLRCFKNKRSADWTDPTKRAPCRKHKWLVDSARSSLAFHSVDTEAMAHVRGACRGKKKKGGAGEAGPLTSDIVNIWKDRKDPLIRETDAYPKLILEMTKEAYTYDDVMFQLYRGERMPDEKEQWTLAQYSGEFPRMQQNMGF